MKNSKVLIVLAPVSTILCPSRSVNAYELATHARLTYKAYAQSVLVQDQSLIKSLGIDSKLGMNPNDPFGSIYYDISGSTIYERDATSPEVAAFEMPVMTERSDNPNPALPWGNNPLPLSLPGWLLRGAIREDDVLQPDNGQPVDDPYNTGNLLLDNRVLNHFYDPVHDWPLTVGVPLGKKAPDWAVGVTDIFNHPNTGESGRRNHFTIFDARELMYRALTGKGRDSSGNEFDAAPSKAERDKYWATLFRALGDIVHLVEDMAQPQHTRNDPHAGKKYDGYPGLYGHKSVYEAYIETRAAAKQFELPSGGKFVPPGLNYGNYKPPHFVDYLSYFTTRQVDGDVMARRGLADYSNRGFFTARTNRRAKSV